MSTDNLTKKLVRVMAAVGSVSKNGRNDFHKYDYVTESDVMDAVRPHLVKENIFITSSVEGSQRDGDFVSVVVKHTIIDADSGERLEVKSLGIGQDKGDKAGNKAVTAATKYFLLKNLMIGSNDDSEASDENGKSTKPTLASVAAAPAKRGFGNRSKATATATVEETNDNTF